MNYEPLKSSLNYFKRFNYFSDLPLASRCLLVLFQFTGCLWRSTCLRHFFFWLRLTTKLLRRFFFWRPLTSELPLALFLFCDRLWRPKTLDLRRQTHHLVLIYLCGRHVTMQGPCTLVQERIICISCPGWHDSLVRRILGELIPGIPTWQHVQR